MALHRFRWLGSLALLFGIGASIPGNAADAAGTRVYIGTYTGKGSKGVYMATLDPATGKLSDPVLAAEAVSPSFLAIHPNKKYLYSVSEIDDFQGKKTGGVAAFAIQPDGKLTLLNKQESKGKGPCHVVVDKAGKNVVVSNYGGGSCACLPIEADGKLKEAISAHQHAGKVHLEKRQGSPHAHSANITPDGKHVFVVDLGLDQVKVFALDEATGKMTEKEPGKADPGAGPRHSAWHPDGKRLFVNGEIDMTLSVFDYDAATGKLTKKQTVSTLPAGEKQTPEYKYSTAEVVVHPSGKFVYVSNRTHDTIAVFHLKDDGKLELVQNQGDKVKVPRNFNVDPSGKWMLVGNQAGGSITVYEIDPATGKLSNAKQEVKVDSPVCIKFFTP